MNNESDEKADIQTGTIELTITDQIVEGTNDVKKVSVKAWDAENGPAIVDSGESTYNTTAKKCSSLLSAPGSDVPAGAVDSIRSIV